MYKSRYARATGMAKRVGVGFGAALAYKQATRSGMFNKTKGSRKARSAPADKPSGISQGVNGYSSNRISYQSKHKKGWQGRKRRVLKFRSRVVKALESTLSQRNNYHTTNAGQLLAAAGGNAYGTLCIENSYADLQNITTAIGTAWKGSATPTGNTQKFCIDTYSMDLALKNNSNSSIIVDLYCCLPRRDTTNTLEGYVVGGNVDQNSTGAASQYGGTLFQSNLAMTQFKVISKRTMILGPGALETIEYRDRKKKYISRERYLQYSNGSSQYRGWSKCWFAMIRGEPCVDSSTVTNTSSAPAKLIWNTSETWWYSYSVNNEVQSTSTLAFSSIGGNPQGVLIDTGATVTDTTD